MALPHDKSGAIAARSVPQRILASGVATSAIRFQNVSGCRVQVRTGAPVPIGDDLIGAGWYALGIEGCADETWLPVDDEVWVVGEMGAEFTLRHD